MSINDNKNDKIENVVNSLMLKVDAEKWHDITLYVTSSWITWAILWDI